MNKLLLLHIPKINLVAWQQRLARYWLLMVIPFVVVFLFSVVTFVVPTSFFTQTTRVFVTPAPLDSVYEEERARQFQWMSSELLAIRLSEWVNGTIFAGIIHDQLLASGIDEDDMTLDDVMAYIEAEPSRSIVQLQVSHPDEAMMNKILATVETTVFNQYLAFTPELNGVEADLAVMDRTLVQVVRPSLVRPLLGVVVRLLMALLAGVLLMFTADYFEPVMYSGWEVQKLGLKSMGEIPKQKVELRQ